MNKGARKRTASDNPGHSRNRLTRPRRKARQIRSYVSSKSDTSESESEPVTESDTEYEAEPEPESDSESDPEYVPKKVSRKRFRQRFEKEKEPFVQKASFAQKAPFIQKAPFVQKAEQPSGVEPVAEHKKETIEPSSSTLHEKVVVPPTEELTDSDDDKVVDYRNWWPPVGVPYATRKRDLKLERGVAELSISDETEQELKAWDSDKARDDSEGPLTKKTSAIHTLFDRSSSSDSDDHLDDVAEEEEKDKKHEKKLSPWVYEYCKTVFEASAKAEEGKPDFTKGVPEGHTFDFYSNLPDGEGGFDPETSDFDVKKDAPENETIGMLQQRLKAMRIAEAQKDGTVDEDSGTLPKSLTPFFWMKKKKETNAKMEMDITSSKQDHISSDKKEAEETAESPAYRIWKKFTGSKESEPEAKDDDEEKFASIYLRFKGSPNLEKKAREICKNMSTYLDRHRVYKGKIIDTVEENKGAEKKDCSSTTKAPNTGEKDATATEPTAQTSKQASGNTAPAGSSDDSQSKADKEDKEKPATENKYDFIAELRKQAAEEKAAKNPKDPLDDWNFMFDVDNYKELDEGSRDIILAMINGEEQEFEMTEQCRRYMEYSGPESASWDNLDEPVDKATYYRMHYGYDPEDAKAHPEKFIKNPYYRNGKYTSEETLMKQAKAELAKAEEVRLKREKAQKERLARVKNTEYTIRINDSELDFDLGEDQFLVWEEVHSEDENSENNSSKHPVNHDNNYAEATTSQEPEDSTQDKKDQDPDDPDFDDWGLYDLYMDRKNYSDDLTPDEYRRCISFLDYPPNYLGEETDVFERYLLADLGLEDEKPAETPPENKPKKPKKPRYTSTPDWGNDDGKFEDKSREAGKEVLEHLLYFDSGEKEDEIFNKAFLKSVFNPSDSDSSESEGSEFPYQSTETSDDEFLRRLKSMDIDPNGIIDKTKSKKKRKRRKPAFIDQFIKQRHKIYSDSEEMSDSPKQSGTEEPEYTDYKKFPPIHDSDVDSIDEIESTEEFVSEVVKRFRARIAKNPKPKSVPENSAESSQKTTAQFVEPEFPENIESEIPMDCNSESQMDVETITVSNTELSVPPEGVDSESGKNIESEPFTDMELQCVEEFLMDIDTLSLDDIKLEPSKGIAPEAPEITEPKPVQDMAWEYPMEIDVESIKEQISKELEPPIEVIEPEVAKNIESESSKDVETESSKNVETESSKNVEAESSKNFETESFKNVEAESSKNVETGSVRNVEGNSSRDTEPQTVQDDEFEALRMKRLNLRKTIQQKLQREASRQMSQPRPKSLMDILKKLFKGDELKTIVNLYGELISDFIGRPRRPLWNTKKKRSQNTNQTERDVFDYTKVSKVIDMEDIMKNRPSSPPGKAESEPEDEEESFIKRVIHDYLKEVVPKKVNKNKLSQNPSTSSALQPQGTNKVEYSIDIDENMILIRSKILKPKMSYFYPNIIIDKAGNVRQHCGTEYFPSIVVDQTGNLKQECTIEVPQNLAGKFILDPTKYTVVPQQTLLPRIMPAYQSSQVNPAAQMSAAGSRPANLPAVVNFSTNYVSQRFQQGAPNFSSRPLKRIRTEQVQPAQNIPTNLVFRQPGSSKSNFANFPPGPNRPESAVKSGYVTDPNIRIMSAGTPQAGPSTSSQQELQNYLNSSELPPKKIKIDYSGNIQTIYPKKKPLNPPEKMEEYMRKPFACDVPGCTKRYKNINGVRYHQKNFHGMDVVTTRKNKRANILPPLMLPPPVPSPSSWTPGVRLMGSIRPAPPTVLGSRENVNFNPNLGRTYYRTSTAPQQQYVVVSNNNNRALSNQPMDPAANIVMRPGSFFTRTMSQPNETVRRNDNPPDTS